MALPLRLCPALLLLIASGVAGTAGAAPPSPGDPPVLCGGEDGVRPIVVLSTRPGRIEIELSRAAVPRAAAHIARLIRGPVFHPDLTSSADGDAGYYDGLRFDHTEPHLAIATGERPPAGAIRVPTEIDAAALGLDRRLVADAAEAMEVLQRELLAELVRNKKAGHVTPRLRAWLDQWYAGYQADFLVGVSRQAINEALGHVYRPGLASLPVRRGAVALWPHSATESSPRLTVFLADLPERDGRWMVVGRVIAGLDVVEAVAARPLRTDLGPKSTTPVDPVVITEAALDCRPGALLIP